MVFDYGERRIGVACANPRAGLAFALKTVPAQDGVPDWEALDALMDEWRPGILVVGLPYNMDGSESRMTQRAREFVKLVGKRYDLPVDTMDERLTSMEASAILREQRRQGIRPRKIMRTDIDSLAARLIAEAWLGKD